MMKTKMILVVSVLSLVAGCATPDLTPKSEAEAKARLYTSAKVVMDNCGSILGSYSDSKQIKMDAEKNKSLAYKLGVTPELMEKASADSYQVWGMNVFAYGVEGACNRMMNSIGNNQ